MVRIVVTEFITVDGVVDSPGGEPGFKHSGWALRLATPEQFQYKLDETMSHDAQLIGRKTYESFAEAWPGRDGAFADRMNSMPKFVASTTLKDPEWNNTTVLQGDTAEAVRALKRDFNGDILVPGSISLVNFLRKHDLVDEFRLMVFPIVLGSGRRLWEDTGDALQLVLDKTEPLPNGTVVMHYLPAGK
jgi:dihydrofolate reductase